MRKPPHPLILSIFFIMVAAYLSCNSDDKGDDTSFECPQPAMPRGNRTIGFDILDATETGDFNLNYQIASRELKADLIQLLQPWNAFENQQAGAYNGDAMGLYEILNDFASSTGASLSLVVTPIDIPGRFLPAYLSGRKFNDPDVISGFNNLLDALFNAETGVMNPLNVIALSVGNEIDHYNWTANNDQVAEYKVFLEGIKSKINSYGIPLHFTGTLYGMTQPGNTWVDFATAVDKVSVTYYPINSDFSVKSPDVVFSDLSNLATKFKGKELFLQEIGYPSSIILNSSQAKQAEFFCNFFNAWDAHKSQIPYASILRLNDVSEASAQATAVAYGVPGNKPFTGYIRTLGIRTWNGKGEAKTAFNTIKQEIERREW